MIDVSNDYSNGSVMTEDNVLFFNSGRSCNFIVLSHRLDGKWLVGKHSFIALKQQEEMRRLGIQFLFVEDEDLYDIAKMRQYLLQEKICGVALEIPHLYFNGDVLGKDTYESMARFYKKLWAENICIYIDGARLLIARECHAIIKTFESCADFIAYGCDKGLYNWSYGTFLKKRKDISFGELQLRRKNWGAYNRKQFFSFQQLTDQIKIDHQKIERNLKKLNVLRQKLISFDIQVNTCETNILHFYIDDIDKNKKLKKMLSKHQLVMNEEGGWYTCYFNFTKDEQILHCLVDIIEKIYNEKSVTMHK